MNLKYYLNMAALTFSQSSRKVKCMLTFLICGMLTYIPVYSTTLWDKASSSAGSMEDAIIGTYNSLWWVAFLLTFIPWLFVKNEKAKNVLKIIWIGVFVGCVVINLKDVVSATLKKITEWFGGTATTTEKTTG